MHTIPCDALPRRGASARVERDDIPLTRTRNPNRDYAYLLRDFAGSDDEIREVVYDESRYPASLIYRGFLSARLRLGLTRVGVAQRGERIFLTRTRDTSEYRRATRELLEVFVDSGEDSAIVRAPEGTDPKALYHALHYRRSRGMLWDVRISLKDGVITLTRKG